MLDTLFSWLCTVGSEILEFGVDFFRVVQSDLGDLFGDNLVGDLVSELLGPFSDMSVAVVATTGMASVYILVSIYKFLKTF